MPVKTYKGIRIHKKDNKWYIISREKGLPFKSGGNLTDIKKRIDKWEKREVIRDTKEFKRKPKKVSFRVIK